MPGVGEPIKLRLAFESLHADNDGAIMLKFVLPASECAKAGLFPILRDFVFEGIFTPIESKQKGL